MPTIYKGQAEIETTDLGLAAFEGRLDFVRERIEQGIDWSREGMAPLFGAAYGRQVEIGRELIRAGSPYDDGTYATLLYNEPRLLDALPPRPDLIAPLRKEMNWGELSRMLLIGDLAEIPKLFDPSRVNEIVPVTYSKREERLIHLAMRHPHLEIIRLLLDAGASVNELTAEGKSALRLLAENPSDELDREKRREIYRYLESRGARCIPEVRGFWRRWSVRRGAWLRTE